MIKPTIAQSRGETNNEQKNKNIKGKCNNRYQATYHSDWREWVTEGILKGVIIGNGKNKAAQFIEMIKKVVLYCVEQNYQYLPEIIKNLKDKPLDHEDFTEPDSDTT